MQPGRFGTGWLCDPWNVVANCRQLSMARTCTLCTHADRLEMERDIIHGKPYRDIAGRFGVSKSAVERHAGDHLTDQLVKAAEADGKITAGRLIAELRALRETTLGVLEEARQQENHGIALQAIARLERQAELVGRLAGELVERQRVEVTQVLLTERWVSLRAAIVRALLVHPLALEAVKRSLEQATGEDAGF